MIAAAFPRAAWRTESEAIYTMALAQAGVSADVAKRAAAALICEELELPPVALVLRRCREISAGVAIASFRCPKCGSERVAGTIGGPGVCFDCDWTGVFS